MSVSTKPAAGQAVEAAIQQFRASADAFLENNPEVAHGSRGQRLRQAREEVIAEYRQLLEAKPGLPSKPQNELMWWMPPSSGIV
ncbi:hypothetical protein [Chelativorans sp. ZYF759]|uniref:hypothetical protein n=1 Tax=Chelativorans sp. ZYF759 TaxID=2692213 RepID=UPI0034D682D3